jgi:hypothetical protein
MTALRRTSALTLVGGLVLAAAAGALAAPRGGSYRGSTAQQSLPLVFGVSARGTTVTNFEPTFIGTCTKRGARQLSTPHIVTDAGRSIAVHNGSFSAHAARGMIRNGTTVIAIAADQVSGQFTSRNTAKGTYSVSFAFNRHAPAPYPGYHCTTGKLTWTARRS